MRCAGCREDFAAHDLEAGASGRLLCEECREIATALVVLRRIEAGQSERAPDPPIGPRTRDPKR